MTARFWRCYARGAFCTHGETFDPRDEDGAIWWAKGGSLHGESPRRIAFLREILEERPSPLESGAKDFFAKKNMSAEEQRAAIAAAPAVEQSAVAAIFRALTEWMSVEEIERFDACENSAVAHVGDEAWLYYFDLQVSHTVLIEHPTSRTYRVEVIDTWNMTRETALRGVSGRVEVPMSSRPYMAVLALAEE